MRKRETWLIIISCDNACIQNSEMADKVKVAVRICGVVQECADLLCIYKPRESAAV